MVRRSSSMRCWIVATSSSVVTSLGLPPAPMCVNFTPHTCSGTGSGAFDRVTGRDVPGGTAHRREVGQTVARKLPGEVAMTPHQMMIVRATFAQVLPIADTAAALFYAKLFELDPSLESMFASDMEAQGRKLMQTMVTVVRSLDDLEGLLPAVRALGMRHVRYGVRDEHYETVGEALLWALEIGLHEGFTVEVRDAWATVYWLLADAMKAGAAGGMLARSA